MISLSPTCWTTSLPDASQSSPGCVSDTMTHGGYAHQDSSITSTRTVNITSSAPATMIRFLKLSLDADGVSQTVHGVGCIIEINTFQCFIVISRF